MQVEASNWNERDKRGHIIGGEEADETGNHNLAISLHDGQSSFCFNGPTTIDRNMGDGRQSFTYLSLQRQARLHSLQLHEKKIFNQQAFYL